MSDEEDVLSDFVDAMKEVGRLAREAEGVERSVGKAEARLLAKLLSRLVPVMPYVDGPVPIAEGWDLPQKNGPGQTPCYREPGITLVNTFASSLGGGEESGVDFTGYKIVFTRSGNLVRLARRGWTEGGDGGGTYWSSEAEPIKITPEFAEDHLKEVIASVANALERGIEKAEGQEKDLERRLSRLKQMEAILGDDS